MIKTFISFPNLEKKTGKLFSFFKPTTWTNLSLVFVFFGIVFISTNRIIWALGFFILGGLMDFIDGNVARYLKKVTPIGAFWDGTVDRFVDAAILSSFFFLEFEKPAEHMGMLLFIGLFVTLMPPFIVAYANHRGAVPDPTEKKIWRIAYRVEYLIFYISAIAINPFSAIWSYWLLVAGILLMAETVFQTIYLTFTRSKQYNK